MKGENVNSTTGQRLNAFMKDRKLRNADLANLLHVSETNISKIRNDKVSLNPVYAEKISEKYGVDAAYLLCQTDFETITDQFQTISQERSEMQQAAVQNAPYRTGTLKRSIVGPRILDNGLEAEVDATVHYAPYVEFGTRFMAPRRYMAYALSVQKKIFYSDLKRLFQ